MRSQTIMLAALFAAFPLVAAAQSTQWVVRDTDGSLVGPVLKVPAGTDLTKGLGDATPLRVARHVPGKWIQLLVTRSAVYGTKDAVPFLYEDYYCNGPAFLDAPQKPNEARATVVFDTDVFWAAGPGESRLIRAKGVLLRDPSQCSAMLIEPNLCCTVIELEEPRFVTEVSGTALAQLSLRPPFRIEPVVAAPKK